MGYKLTFLDHDNFEVKLGAPKAIQVKRNRNVNKLNQGQGLDNDIVFTNVLFHKEIYQPGCVEFTIQFKANKLELSGSIDLMYDDHIIAKNYYIFEKITRGVYVTYKAYSRDKFLAIDKFCQSFTGKKFFEGMVYSFLNTPKSIALKAFVKGKNADGTINLGIKSSLNHLVYDETKTEYIIPYSVQYNESYYDFLVRMSNRYGEFLYCEDDVFHVGLEIGTTRDLSEEAYKDMKSFERREYCQNLEDIIKYCAPNYLDAKEESIAFMDLVESDGIVAEDYFNPIENKEYAIWSDYTPPVSTAFDLVTSFTNQSTLSEALASLEIMTSLRFGISAKFKDEINDKYSKLFFNKEVLSVENCDNKDNATQRNEYATYGKYINNEWYANILKNEDKSEKGKAVIEYTTYHHFLLGDKVKYEGAEFIVYSVEAAFTPTWNEKEHGESFKVVLVPFIDTKVYPLPMRDLHIRKAAPQRAKVVSNFDPERLGRVLVKYPWQYMFTGEEEKFKGADDKQNAALVANMQTSTPWIRVAYPMASESAGFMFFPSVGDEVLIDYEDGNIERPFVNGSFYTAQKQPSVPSSTHMVGVTKSITSHNGHHLSFVDNPGDLRFMANLIPGWSFASKFGWGLDAHDKLLDKYGKYMSGGFELGDYLGVYSIKGSTHDRNITISSPAGDIVLDAFSGITIKAPLGDVNIIGKNVNIEARNNLKMTSGTNIKSFYSLNPSAMLEDAKKIIPAPLIGVLKKVAGLDLSFHRTWLEVLLRPIGGTMLMKSHRYMMLEAGDGQTHFPISRDKNKDSNVRKVGKFLIHRPFSEVDWSNIASKLILIKENVDKSMKYAVDLYSLIIDVEPKVNEYKLIIKGRESELSDRIRKSVDGLKSTDYLNEGEQFTSINEKMKAMNDSYTNYKSYLEEIEKYKLENSGIWSNIYDKCMGDEQTLKEWMQNNGNGNLSLERLFDVSTKRECLFKEIQKYVQSHDNLRDQIEMTSFDFTSLEELSASVKIKTSGVMVNLANKIFGTEGMKDDNVWTTRDKGGIIFSANKNQCLNLANDGTLKPGYEMDVVELIKEMIRDVK